MSQTHCEKCGSWKGGFISCDECLGSEPFEETVTEPKASQILRLTKLKQCKYQFHESGAYCVQGVLMKYLGCPDSSLDLGKVWANEDNKFMKQMIDDLLGGSESMQSHITDMNNSGKSFSEIADYLESIGL